MSLVNKILKEAEDDFFKPRKVEERIENFQPTWHWRSEESLPQELKDFQQTCRKEDNIKYKRLGSQEIYGMYGDLEFRVSLVKIRNAPRKGSENTEILQDNKHSIRIELYGHLTGRAIHTKLTEWGKEKFLKYFPALKF